MIYHFASYSPIQTHTRTPMAVNHQARHWPNHWEKFGVQCLAQGHFDMWTGGDVSSCPWAGETGGWPANLLINRKPTLPPYASVVFAAGSAATMWLKNQLMQVLIEVHGDEKSEWKICPAQWRSSYHAISLVCFRSRMMTNIWFNLKWMQH